MVLAVAAFGVGQWRELGSSNVGLAFSQSIQMLVFYTWSIRLLADTIGLFGSAEKLTWLANHTPQEGGRLAPPELPGRRGGKRSTPALPSPADAEVGCFSLPANSTVGVKLPAPLTKVRAALAHHLSCTLAPPCAALDLHCAVVPCAAVPRGLQPPPPPLGPSS